MGLIWQDEETKYKELRILTSLGESFVKMAEPLKKMAQQQESLRKELQAQRALLLRLQKDLDAGVWRIQSAIESRSEGKCDGSGGSDVDPRM